MLPEQPPIEFVLYPIIEDRELIGYLWRAEHDGDHVYVNGFCSCGRMDVGVS